MDVLTVTLNPALDREIIVENFKINEFHRVKNPSYSVMDPGGKGINVSVILSGLGVRNVAMGFLGGYIGKVVEERLRLISDLITTAFVHVEEETRENIAIVDPLGETITEINSSGPLIKSDDLRMFIRRFEVALSRAKHVVVSGSIPRGVDNDICKTLCKKVTDSGKISFAEGIGPAFEIAVEAGVITVARPDLRSRKLLFGETMVELEDYVRTAKKIIESGSRLAILSYAIEGDVIATRDGIWLFKTKGHIDRSHLLGTGDAFMAGVVHSMIENENDCFLAAKRGMAAAVAEAEYIGKELISLEDIEQHLDSFDIRKLE
ncbi:PfkB family carbohydrate kinase [Mesotoga sp. H07pep.5.4]|uniref:1-phosphofructokinase family hexose kinase n=2 Tax=Mesotoga TaxID=1184396 RepID=UPI000EF15B2A|nr:PfkB family carbohydrate kinase [Mesotoga sp. H07pep.5.4]MCP5457368.1 1-phosphofructokinase family hexose kinase [Thermotogota bacterium]MDK2944282.1 1-phosphofructokinase [Mesotoga sp.]RLL85977.1 ribokinase [Mesotoga sp. H07pep.5.4]